MTGSMRRYGLILYGAGAALCAAIGAAGLAGYRVNLTPSYPRGLWRIVEIDRAYGVGDVVFICAPLTPAFELAKARGYLPRGHCPGWTAPLIKEIAAAPGQEVSIGVDVRVDGAPIPNSTVQSADADGRTLHAAGSGVVANGDVFLLAPHPHSFDSRYFGPLPATGILGLARPVFVHGS